MKLFDTIAMGDQIPLFEQVAEGLKTAVNGKSDQFLFNIDTYLNKIPEARYSMAERGRRTILKLAEAYDWKGNREDLVAPLDLNYLAIFQMLEDYVVVGIDMEKASFPTALYTRSIAILNYLWQDGMIEDGIEPGKYMANLIGNKTHKSILEGNFVTQRLDVIGIKNGKPCFRPMTPQSNLNIGGGKQYVAIPVPFMYMVELMVKSHFRGVPFKFVKSSTTGQISHIATVNGNVVRQAYEGLDKVLIESKLRKTKVGYDVIRQRFYAYDLESSISSIGVATFRPEMLDSIVEATPAEIDKSQYGIDFNLLRGIFKTKVKGAKLAQLNELNFIDLKGFANMKDKVGAVTEAVDKTSDKALFYLMKGFPELFGDLDEVLATRERMTPKFLKGLELIDLPEDEQSRIILLAKMLETGVIKFTVQSKAGAIFERTGTCNKVVLERILGKDYVRDFESIRNKLYHVREMLQQGKITNRIDLEKVGVEYNILDHVDAETYFADSIDRGDVSHALTAVSWAIERLKTKGASKRFDPSLLLYRDLHASEPKEFFGSINVNNIIAVEFSQV